MFLYLTPLKDFIKGPLTYLTRTLTQGASPPDGPLTYLTRTLTQGQAPGPPVRYHNLPNPNPKPNRDPNAKPNQSLTLITKNLILALNLT